MFHSRISWLSGVHIAGIANTVAIIRRSKHLAGVFMQEASPRLPYTLAIIMGVILWTLTAALGGRIEPWDAPGYWTVGYPLGILLAAVLGYVFPDRAWRWALVLMFMQGVVMLLGGAGLGLLPLGLIVLGVLSLPAVAAASLVARFSRKARAS